MFLRIAFRNIFRQKRRSVLTGLSMFGGFVLGSFFIAWADGTYNNIIDTFTRTRLGHIQVHAPGYLDDPSIYKTIDDAGAVAASIEETEGLEGWAPRVYFAGLISGGDKSSGGQIVGIDPVLEARTTRFDERIVQGRSLSAQPSKEAVLGSGLARNLGIEPGGSVVILSQAADGSIANDSYDVVGIAETGDEMSDRPTLTLHLDDARELMVLDGRVHEIALVVDNLGDVRRLARRLEERLEPLGLSVEPWQVFARSFYKAMKADKQGMWISLLVIILIVAVGVLNTVLMSVLERRREYGLLKAVGTRPRQVFKIVMTEAVALALICILIGAAVAFLLNSYVSSHGLRLGEPISYGGITLEDMTTEINLRSFVIPAVTVLLTAFFSGFIPAIMAARTVPVKSMRMH